MNPKTAQADDNSKEGKRDSLSSAESSRGHKVAHFAGSNSKIAKAGNCNGSRVCSWRRKHSSNDLRSNGEPLEHIPIPLL